MLNLKYIGDLYIEVSKNMLHDVGRHLARSAENFGVCFKFWSENHLFHKIFHPKKIQPPPFDSKKKFNPPLLGQKKKSTPPPVFPTPPLPY